MRAVKSVRWSVFSNSFFTRTLEISHAMPIESARREDVELLPGCEITLTDVGLFDGMLLLEPGCVALHSAAPPQPARVAPPTWEEGSIDVTDPPPRFSKLGSPPPPVSMASVDEALPAAESGRPPGL